MLIYIIIYLLYNYVDALFYIRENRSLKEHCGQEHEE